MAVVPYHSADAAAVAWGRKYGNSAILNHMEFSSVIYKKGDYYYFTTAIYFNNDEDIWHSSPTIQYTQRHYPKNIPEGGEIIGNIHSHHWIGKGGHWNSTFSDNNRPRVAKYPVDDEFIMSKDPQYAYYLYNYAGKILVRRPNAKKTGNSGDDTNEIIAEDLTWDPDAETNEKDENGNPIKFGPYPQPGRYKLTDQFQVMDMTAILQIQTRTKRANKNGRQPCSKSGCKRVANDADLYYFNFLL